ncbi:hypothetical protein [Micromonospora sp. NPDC049679]|uniref:hypothetical protein n=1 Tax=Micromonospora sp. NPDC049679 TaxID=3155920 RepID=UPI0033E556CC
MALAVVVVLDAVPLVGVVIPTDAAILTAMGVGTPFAAAGSFVWVIGQVTAAWPESTPVGPSPRGLRRTDLVGHQRVHPRTALTQLAVTARLTAA